MAAVKSGINKVGNSYYQSITTDQPDGSVGTTMYRVNADGSGKVPIYDVDKPAGSNSLVKSFDTNATAEEKKQLSDPNSQLSQVRSQQITSSNPYGDNATAEQKQAVNAAAGKPNAATNTEGQQEQGSNPAAEAIADIGKTKARISFPQDLKYPSNLQTKHQDVIKFNMLKYEPRSLNESANQGLGSFGERSNFISRTIGSVFLPIPGGISDTNAVDWQSDKLPAGAKALADLANSMITAGGEETAKTLERQAGQVQQGSSEIKKGIAAYFTEQAIGQSNILSRTQGAIQNPNMELLFSGPTLRPFSFTFKLSARSTKDKEQIIKIIRFFKQGMAVQRSESQLFLKAPHTFKIQYLHKSEDHPYINLIKECALQSFTVNYTPEGNYMTFADGLMTSYEIQMQFQELEPIFNDDYPKDNDASIGY